MGGINVAWEFTASTDMKIEGRDNRQANSEDIQAKNLDISL